MSNEIVLDSTSGTSLNKKWFILTPTKSSTYLITLTTTDASTYGYCSLYSYEHAFEYRVVKEGYDAEPTSSDYTDMQSPGVKDITAEIGGLCNGISSPQYIYQVTKEKTRCLFP